MDVTLSFTWHGVGGANVSRQVHGLRNDGCLTVNEGKLLDDTTILLRYAELPSESCPACVCLGRDDRRSHVVIPVKTEQGPLLSRAHCSIKIVSASPLRGTVSDCESLNGTFVGGVKLARGGEADVIDDISLSFGAGAKIEPGNGLGNTARVSIAVRVSPLHRDSPVEEEEQIGDIQPSQHDTEKSPSLSAPGLDARDHGYAAKEGYADEKSRMDNHEVPHNSGVGEGMVADTIDDPSSAKQQSHVMNVSAILAPSNLDTILSEHLGSRASRMELVAETRHEMDERFSDPGDGPNGQHPAGKPDSVASEEIAPPMEATEDSPPAFESPPQADEVALSAPGVDFFSDEEEPVLLIKRKGSTQAPPVDFGFQDVPTEAEKANPEPAAPVASSQKPPPKRTKRKNDPDKAVNDFLKELQGDGPSNGTETEASIAAAKLVRGQLGFAAPLPPQGKAADSKQDASNVKDEKPAPKTNVRRINLQSQTMADDGLGLDVTDVVPAVSQDSFVALSVEQGAKSQLDDGQRPVQGASMQQTLFSTLHSLPPLSQMMDSIDISAPKESLPFEAVTESIVGISSQQQILAAVTVESQLPSETAAESQLFAGGISQAPLTTSRRLPPMRAVAAVSEGQSVAQKLVPEKSKKPQRAQITNSRKQRMKTVLEALGCDVDSEPSRKDRTYQPTRIAAISPDDDVVLINSSRPVLLPKWLQESLKTHQVDAVRFLWAQLLSDGEEDSRKAPRQRRDLALQFADDLVADSRPSKKTLTTAKQYGAILAHEMGLGKTFTCLAFMLTLFATIEDRPLASQLSSLPSECKAVVVVPKAAVDHWADEAAKWCDATGSELNICICSAANREFRAKIIEFWMANDRSVLVVSHQLFTAIVGDSSGDDSLNEPSVWDDIAEDDAEVAVSKSVKDKMRRSILKRTNLLIVDEAHRIGGPGSRFSSALKRFPSSVLRVALTGTPTMGGKDLRQLQGLLNFVRGRGGSGSSDSEQDLSVEMQQLMHFCPRNSSVQLPEVSDWTVKVRLSVRQAELLERLLATFRSSTSPLDMVRKANLITNHVALAALWYAEHRGDQSAEWALPATYEPSPYTDGVPTLQSNPKFLLALHLLDSAVAAGEKSVVFSSSVTTLQIMGYILLQCGLTDSLDFAILDSHTNDELRRGLIARFNDPADRLSIILTTYRVSGHAISLIGARRVVLFEPCWDPHEERQAIARASRIGSKQPLSVFRLLCDSPTEDIVLTRGAKGLSTSSRGEAVAGVVGTSDAVADAAMATCNDHIVSVAPTRHR